jgi:hypothetical protein
VILFFFWNTYGGQFGGCENGGAFKLSSFYCSLQNKLILQEHIIDVYGVEVSHTLLQIPRIRFTHTS